jgi:hypothetical protein
MALKSSLIATNSSGVWVHEVVDDARSIGDVTSIAIDRFGQPHINYYDATRESSGTRSASDP